jgi:ABC-type polysaccharide/polyol phosphate export permease
VWQRSAEFEELLHDDEREMVDRQYLNLLRELAITRYKVKDQSTFLGFLWSFLHPLIMLGLLFILFSGRVGKEIDHYAIYLLIGLVQFTHFSTSTNRAMHVLVSMKHLTSDTIFPKELLVIGSVLADIIELIAAMAVCVIIAKIAGVDLSWPVFMLPVVFLLQITLVLWVSLCLSCLYVFVRDLTYVYQAFVRVLLFATPIFYAPSFIEQGAAQYIIWLNPLSHLVSFSRSLIIGGEVFPLPQLMIFLAVNVALLYGSIRLFRSYEPVFAEYV